MAPTVEVLSDKATLTGRAHQVMTQSIQDAIAQRGYATIALSGGSTPKPLYESMVGADIDWNQLYVLWGDERYVPHDHPRSNAKMASDAWLSRIDIPSQNVLPMPTSAGDPSTDAKKYAQTLTDFFQGRQEIDIANGKFPQVDFVLQGMGDDGHTASLFPHTDALDVCDRLVTVGNHDGEPRLTFTVPLINRGRKVIFLVAGENKQDALSHVFDDQSDPHNYPSRFIQSANPLWLVDAAAGQGIPDEFKA